VAPGPPGPPWRRTIRSTGEPRRSTGGRDPGDLL